MYRFFEILPGALSWLTIILMVVLARVAPVVAAIFIILFDIYWLLKTIYLSLHLRATFRAMREVMKVDWLERLKSEPAARNWPELYHLVILPMSTEPVEVVRESFLSLTRSNYPLDRFIVVLAIEDRIPAGHEVARAIEAEFGRRFHRFLVTKHPDGLPGEIRGKGSNETWAAKAVKREVIDREKIPYKNVIATVFDVDTQIFPDYFSRLTHVFLGAEDRLRAIYQPIPFFTNNIYQSPAFGRVVSFSSTFWQMMQQARPERLTSFSSQSVPFQVLVDIDFWQKDAVSEDSRIFWQGYLRYDGRFRCEPLNYPVSMDANVAPTFWKTVWNTYKQHRRWAWGAENVAYLLHGFLKNPKIPTGRKWFWGLTTIEGYHSWATNALIIFAMGWLPVTLGGAEFNDTLLSYSLPEITRFIVNLSMVGVATSAILSFMLLPPRPAWFRFYHYPLYFLQWLLMPVTLIFFGCIPALEAQTRLALSGRFRLGFWVTPKHRVS